MPRNTPTVLVCMDHYLESRRGDFAVNTMNNTRSVLMGFVNGVGKDRYREDRPLGNVTPFQVEKWFAKVVSEKNPSARSFNKVRTTVMYFLKYCTAHGWVTKDLCQDVHRRKPMFTERMQLSGPELVAFLDIAENPRDRGVLATGINTGLRSSEITGIKVGHVDFDNQEIYVIRTKSYRDDRIGMTKALEKELRAWLTCYAESIDEPLDDDMYLFPARTAPKLASGGEPGGERVVIPAALRPDVRLTKAHRVVQRALVKFGVTVTYQEGLHTLRRSAARQFFESCAEMGHDGALRSTAALLGHKSVMTTEGYLGISGDRIKRNKMLKGRNFLPFDEVATVTKLRPVADSTSE